MDWEGDRTEDENRRGEIGMGGRMRGERRSEEERRGGEKNEIDQEQKEGREEEQQNNINNRMEDPTSIEWLGREEER